MDQEQQEDKAGGAKQEEFKDEHDLEESESGATGASAAQEVLNSAVMDEKAMERHFRAAATSTAASPRSPKKVKSAPSQMERPTRSRSPQRRPHQQPLSQSETAAIGGGAGGRQVQFAMMNRPGARRNDDDDENQNEPDVNLLHLAAERSRGIYRDTDSSTDIKQDEESDLLRGSAYDPIKEKVRHMQLERSHNNNDDEDAKAKAQAITMPSLSSAPSSSSSPNNNNRNSSSNTSNDTTPGAYAAAPGMGIQRTPAFDHGVLRHPEAATDDFIRESTRSSTSAMPEFNPTTLLQNQTSTFTSISQQQQQQSLDNNYNTNGGVGAAAAGFDGEVITSAVPVDEDDLEMHIRDEINNEAAQAEVVDLDQEVETKVEKFRKQYYWYGAIALGLVSLVITGMVLGILKLRHEVNANDAGGLDLSFPIRKPQSLTTLISIREKGYMICGLTKRDESATFDTDHLKGLISFKEDICKAIAAAALGGDPNVTLIAVTEGERWRSLENGTLDVLLVGTPGISESLHWNLDPRIPVQFSTPYVFDGVGAGGMPEYVANCASEEGYTNYAQCQMLKVCTVQGSKSADLGEQRLHPNQMLVLPRLEDVYSKFADGCCNVISTDYSSDRAEVVIRNATNYTGPYAMGDGLYSRQPYAAATRKFAWTYKRESMEEHLDDPHTWTEFVNWVINALFAAEEASITKSRAFDFPQTKVFGANFTDAFRHAIAAVGHYGEVYERNRQGTVPRVGMNLLNDGKSGLHYGRSGGSLTDFGPPPFDNGTLSNIRVRGKLRCGLAMPQYINATAKEMIEMSPAQLEEMEEEMLEPAYMMSPEIMGTATIDFYYCKALASAVFQGRLTVEDSASCSVSMHQYGLDDPGVFRPNIDLIMLKDENDGYNKLDRGEIDVIVGFRQDLQGDVWKKGFDEGFTFTQPYFFGPTEEHVTGANRCMVTRQHDQQWSDYVQLVVASLFLAEEGKCTQASANEMPVVNRFGPMYKRMLRDVVFAVGNYAQVYERSVEPIYPRKGTANELNLFSTPQLAAMPGLLRKDQR